MLGTQKKLCTCLVLYNNDYMYLYSVQNIMYGTHIQTRRKQAREYEQKFIRFSFLSLHNILKHVYYNVYYKLLLCTVLTGFKNTWVYIYLLMIISISNVWELLVAKKCLVVETAVVLLCLVVSAVVLSEKGGKWRKGVKTVKKLWVVLSHKALAWIFVILIM